MSLLIAEVGSSFSVSVLKLLNLDIVVEILTIENEFSVLRRMNKIDVVITKDLKLGIEVKCGVIRSIRIPDSIFFFRYD